MSSEKTKSEIIEALQISGQLHGLELDYLDLRRLVEGLESAQTLPVDGPYECPYF